MPVELCDICKKEFKPNRRGQNAYASGFICPGCCEELSLKLLVKIEREMKEDKEDKRQTYKG
jgi:predicted amidophosphoribosyltransferase